MEKPTKEELKCDYCKSSHIIRDGTGKHGKQRFMCMTCNKTFSSRNKAFELAVAKEEGRLSAFKEVGDWAKKQKRKEEKNYLEASETSQRSFFYGRKRAYYEVVEFAEAQIKKVGKR